MQGTPKTRADRARRATRQPTDAGGRAGAARRDRLSDRRRERLQLTALSVVAAVFAAVLYEVCFERGSLNNDEVAYLLQARSIRDGSLFPEPVEPVAEHRIWFFVPQPVGLVSKYLPLVSMVFAAGLLATGSVVPVLALLAAVLPWLVAGLAREVGLRGRQVITAAALVSLSPVVLMETALPLSYQLFLVLITAVWWLVLRSARGRGRPQLLAGVGIGLLVGAAAACRPYDTLLLATPPLTWAAWRRGRGWWRCGLGAVVGLLPVAVAVGLYDHRATGSALTPPFNLLEPSDTIGFGVRRMYPEQTPHHFGPLQGLSGLALHFGLGLLTWLTAGAVLVPAAVMAWRRVSGAPRVLLVASGLQLVGYWMFWGPWNFSVLWGDGTRVLGPVYAMALTVPIVVVALPLAEQWLARSGPRRRLVVTVLAVVAVAQLGSAVVEATIDARRTSLLLDLVARSAQDGPVLLDTDPPYLGHPVSGLIDGLALSANSGVPAPGAPLPYLLQLPKAVYGPSTLTYALSTQRRVEGPELELQVSITERHADVLVVERGGVTRACALGPDGSASRPTATQAGTGDEPVARSATVVVSAAGASGCDGALVPDKWQREVAQRCMDTSCLMLAVFRVDDDGRERRLTLRKLPVRTVGDVAMLVDGRVVASSGRGWLRVGPA